MQLISTSGSPGNLAKATVMRAGTLLGNCILTDQWPRIADFIRLDSQFEYSDTFSRLDFENDKGIVHPRSVGACHGLSQFSRGKCAGAPFREACVTRQTNGPFLFQN